MRNSNASAFFIPTARLYGSSSYSHVGLPMNFCLKMLLTSCCILRVQYSLVTIDFLASGECRVSENGE